MIKCDKCGTKNYAVNEQDIIQCMCGRWFSSPTNIMTDKNTCHAQQSPITAPSNEREAIH